jgi:hypothetical protein
VLPFTFFLVVICNLKVKGRKNEKQVEGKCSSTGIVKNHLNFNLGELHLKTKSGSVLCIVQLT